MSKEQCQQNFTNFFQSSTFATFFQRFFSNVGISVFHKKTRRHVVQYTKSTQTYVQDCTSAAESSLAEQEEPGGQLNSRAGPENFQLRLLG